MQAIPKNNLSPTKRECQARFQTLCNINGQLVKDNMTIIYDNTVIAGQTYNLAEIWNEIQDAMKAVYNLATQGIRGPDISGLTDKQKNDYTTLTYYNDLLSRLKKSTISGIEYIKALDFIQNLQDGIKNYQLDSTLCNVCNSSCQYCNTCETKAQKCGSCYSGLSCSEGGCGSGCNGNCCMSGCWGGLNCAGYMCNLQ